MITHKHDFHTMGTEISVEIIVETEVDATQINSVLRQSEKIFLFNEQVFSRFNPQSELSQINQNTGREIKISKKMFDVISLCLDFYESTDKYFDPRIIDKLERIGYNQNFKNINVKQDIDVDLNLNQTDHLRNNIVLDQENSTLQVAKRIDLTGIVKGYTVDEVANYLQKMGFSKFIVDAGGDMFAKDTETDGWQIDVEGATDKNFCLKLKNSGIATSGITRKKWQIKNQTFHHLINPKNPSEFSDKILSVSVIAGKTIEADIMAKALFLMGQDKGLDFANKKNIAALFLDKNGKMTLSSKMKEYEWKI